MGQCPAKIVSMPIAEMIGHRLDLPALLADQPPRLLRLHLAEIRPPAKNRSAREKNRCSVLGDIRK